MNDETAKRRALAQRVADAYRRELNACAAALFGSTSRNLADEYSDIDMTVFFTELPERTAAMTAVARVLGATDWKKLWEGDDNGFADTFVADGIECQVGSSTLAYLEEIMEDVLLRNDTDHDKHTIMGGYIHALPLYGGEIVERWRKRIEAYPPDLAREMVRAHLDFRPLWLLRKRFAGRDTLIVFHSLMSDLSRKLLGVHLGLNRIYPEHDFKRLGDLTARMTIAPRDFDRRLRTLMNSDYESALREARGLIEETFALVERHMPELDITEARSKFDRPDPVAMARRMQNIGTT